MPLHLPIGAEATFEGMIDLVQMNSVCFVEKERIVGPIPENMMEQALEARRNLIEKVADLDDEIAVAVLQKMDESQAAKVLASLDPGHSARLTRSIYTGRRSSMTSPGDQIVPAPRGEEGE